MSRPNRIALIIIDGLGDRPIKELGERTPLEAAETPNMDYMASNGLCGIVIPFKFKQDKTPTSEGTHAAIFNHLDNFLGRGPYEALGAGINLKENDIAFRGNYAIINQKMNVIDRRAGRIKKTEHLSNLLSKEKIRGVRFIVKSSIGHRAVLVMRGKGLSEMVSSNDPKENGKPARPIRALSKEAVFTAEVLNEFLERAKDILKREKANYILLRGPGRYRKVPSFKERYSLNSYAIGSGGIYLGMPKTLGMKIITSKKMTGFSDTSVKDKISILKKHLKKNSFVFCHIKGVDNLSHDGDFIGKKEFIERIDKEIKGFDKNSLIIITGDHSTLCVLKDHSSDSVPLLIYGGKKGKSSSFSEKECRKGDLGKIKQERLLELIFGLLN